MVDQPPPEDESRPSDVPDTSGQDGSELGPTSSSSPAAAATASTTSPSWRARRRATKARRSTMRRRLTRTAITVVLVVVVLAGATVGYGIYRFNQFHRVKSKQLTPTAATGGIENILLIGSTNRCAVTTIKEFILQCRAGVTGINSDVVMVVRLDPANHRVTLLSIPRDTFVPNARTGGLYNKIDASLVDGPSQLAEAISQDYGIAINHFVELNFQTFSNVVSVLGGLRMYFPDRLFDANSDLTITRTGCQYLTGVQALQLVRSRHLYYFTRGEKINYAAIRAAGNAGTYYTPNSGGRYDGSGDLGRITRVHLFVKALAREVQQRGLGNPLTDNALIGAVAPYLTIDNTLGNSELFHLILDFHSAHISTIPELTLPVVSDAATFYYKGYNYGLDVFPSEPQDQQAIDAFTGTTPPGWKLHPSSITVSVVDGTNVPAQTASVARRLAGLGYRIVPTTAVHYTGPVSETTVVYAPGHLQQAERVMASLAGTVILGEGTPTAGADVSVIAGSDLTVRGAVTATAAPTTTTTTTKPPRSTTTSSTAVTTTTRPATTTTAAPRTTTTAPSTAVTTTTNPNIAPPTPASPAIPRYDPRTCFAK